MDRNSFFIGLNEHMDPAGHAFSGRNTVDSGNFTANRFNRFGIVHLVILAPRPPSAAAAPHCSWSWLGRRRDSGHKNTDHSDCESKTYLLHLFSPPLYHDFSLCVIAETSNGHASVVDIRTM
jgi:hypothetical protein